MKNIILMTILICCLQGTSLAQVVTRRGNAEWIEQQENIYVKGNIEKYSIPPDVIETKTSFINKNDINKIIDVNINLDSPFEVLTSGTVISVNDTLEIFPCGFSGSNIGKLSVMML
jgi:hypothetical protein